jgi:SAM-dependent methyltransferase
MSPTSLFPHSRREFSDAAREALNAVKRTADTYFLRHESGDWGDVPDWLIGDNNRAIGNDRSSHAIRSQYRLDDAHNLFVVTAPDRARTRLMLAEEFVTREVSVREGYAHWAAVYDGDNPLIAVEEPVFDAILAALPDYSTAIDAGTGTGRVARKLARRVPSAKVIGVDATPEMLAIARARAEQEGLDNLRFEQIALGEASLPCGNESIDLVTCALMLCHLPDPQGAVAEFARVLRPGGRLLISDFHPSVDFFGWRPDFTTTEGRLLLPYTPNSREGYLDVIAGAGFAITEVHDIGLDGQPYGEVTEETMKANGAPPLCIVISAVKCPKQ